MDASIVDKDLIERINKGEEKAFEVLYPKIRNYHPIHD